MSNEQTPINDQQSSASFLKFPDNFLWGTATSAYQVEGGINNDWSEWERSKSRQAALKKKGASLKDYVCGQACDFWNRYESDLDLVSGLGTNAIRLGLEWARIEPEQGTWGVETIRHYRAILEAAKSRGQKVVLTLWHWTLPLWLARHGGWDSEEALDHWERYTDLVVKECGALVDHWVTLNEPMMYLWGSYLTGRFPPNKRNPIKADKVMRQLVRAHEIASRTIHTHFPDASVGITGLYNFIEPAHKWNPLEQAIARTLHWYWNRRFLERVVDKCDYIGANYYFHDRIIWYPPFKKNRNKEITDKNWEIYPEGIYHVLKWLAGYKKPIYILENGLADRADSRRKAFIRDHLVWTHRAIAEGADVRGYFHWSLLDNFEWDSGWAPRFGLYGLDRHTLERTERGSVAYYREICRRNGVDPS